MFTPSRSFTALALAASVALPAAAQENVNFYNWSDYIAEDTLSNFTGATGIDVTYDVYDNNEIVEAKLLAGSSGYDIVVPTAMPFVARLIQAGALQKLDKSQIPNLAGLDAALMDRIRSADPTLEYTAIYQWGTNGIGVNVAKVRERLGEDAELSSYDLVFNPEVVGKLADCGVTFVDSPDEVYPVLFNYLGFDPAEENSDAIAAAEAQMLAIRDSVRYFHSSRYIDDLASGEICVAYGFSGDIYQALNDSAEGVEINYVIPVEGTIQWADVMAIPADAPNLANAHQLINYLLEPAVMAGITNYVYYPNAVPASLPMVEDEVKNDPGIYPDAETSARLFPSSARSPRFARQITRSWTKVRTGE